MKTDKKELMWHIPLLIAVFIQLWNCSFYSAVADSFYDIHFFKGYGPDFPGYAEPAALPADA